MTEAEAARAFIDAFNERDLDAFVATLHPEVELHASRGLRKGIEAAREWATRAPGGLQQRILVEDVLEAEDRALALIRREWWWGDPPPQQRRGSASLRSASQPGTDLAGSDEMAWLFEFRDGLISSWRAFDERDEAIGAFGQAGV